MEYLIIIGLLLMLGKTSGGIYGTKSAWFEPYKEGKPTLSHDHYKNKSGVYLIKNKNSGEVVYVGYSGTNLYRTLYRHFQEWNDREQRRRVYPKNSYKVRIIVCTPAQAERLEKYFINKIKPKDNNFQYEAQFDKKENEKAAELVNYFESEQIHTETEVPF